MTSPPRGRVQPLPAVILTSFALMAAAVVAAALALYIAYARSLPDVTSLADYPLPEGSVIVSADGQELATFAATNRRLVSYEQIPTVLVEATVAAEDRTFWDNPCVDPRAIVRAVLQNLSAGEVVSGASTVCQQLVRNTLLPAELLADPHRQLERKLKEAMLALRLDAEYPGAVGKQQIMEFYLNQNYYGNNAYGAWAAVSRYFGKDFTDPAPENQLTPGEAALVAGLVRAPSALDPTLVGVPIRDTEGHSVLRIPTTSDCLAVRDSVLEAMVEEGFLTPAELDTILAQPANVKVPEVTVLLAPHFVYAVRRQVAAQLGSEEIIDTGGLRIETTLDYAGYQVFAEKWVQVVYDLDRLSDAELREKYGADAMDWINQLQDRNVGNDAMVALNYRTGAVLAYVGSANFYGEATPQHQPQFDVVGQAYRQSGSAIKPVMYATGFERGAITPATMFMDVSTAIVPGYTVTDADGRERGPVRVRDALKYSLNIPATKAQQLIGTDAIVDQAERLGLRWDAQQDPHVASLTLGTIGVRMLDLAGAYGALANGGLLNPPYLVQRILDSDGHVLYDHAADAPAPQQVISPQAAFLVTDILADNTNPRQNRWWGGRFQLPTDEGRRPATLKTGTTTDFRDLQAFGFLAADPDPSVSEGAIVAGVWVGNSDFSPIKSVFAADGPTFIWHAFMTDITAHNELPVRDFVQPSGVVEATVDAMTGLAPGEFTTSTRTEVFISGTQPSAADDRHRELAVEAATGSIWQEGCGDPVTPSPGPSPAEPPGPPRPPGPPEPPPPFGPILQVYLDLVDWDAQHPVWEASNRAWIDKWFGREDKLRRFPLAVLDAPLAPTTTCTPGAVPTSTPTPIPTETATPSPTLQPTDTPSPSPTPSPTP